MANEWYCEIDGRLFGPYSSRSLKQFAANGKLRPQHRVRQGPDGQWTSAGKVRGLFDEVSMQDNGDALGPSISPSSAALTSRPSVTPPPLPRLRHDRLKARLRPTLTVAIGVVALVAVIGGWALVNRRASESIPAGSAASAAATSLSIQDAQSKPKGKSFDGTFSTAAPSSVPAADSLTETDDLTPVQLFALASPAVVKITTKNEDGKILGHGSGFVISTNELRSPLEVAEGRHLASNWGALGNEPDKTFQVAYVCTNYHVIKPALEASVEFADRTKGEVAEILAYSDESDLAVLKTILETDNEPKELSLAENVPAIGSAVCAIGSPLALDYSLSNGIISSVRTMGDTTLLQTTTAISPGSSGGPLLSVSGQVVGITTASHPGGQNLNFAVSTKTLRTLLDGKYEKAPLSKGKSHIAPVNDAFIAFYFDVDRHHHDGHSLLDARKLLRAGKYSEVITILEGSHEPVPDEYVYLEKYVLGVAYDNLLDAEWEKQINSLEGEYEDAFSIFQAAVRRSPSFRRTVQNLETSVSLNPMFAPAHYRLAYRRFSAGRWEQALMAADQLVALLPLCSDAYRLRGKCHVQLEHPRLAASDFEEAVKLNPRDGSNHFEYAGVLSQLLDHKGSIASYLRAVGEGGVGGSVWTCHANISEEYGRLGDLEKAKAYLSMALEGGMPRQHYDAAIARLQSER